MFVDASAMVTILVEESDGAALARRLEQAADRCTSAIAVYEAIVGVSRVCTIAIGDAEIIVDRFLEEAVVRIVPITAEIGRGAVAAFDRYGRGVTRPHSTWVTALPMRAPADSICPSSSRARTFR